MKNFLLIAVLLFLTWQPVWGQDGPEPIEENPQQRLKELLGNLKSLQGNFIQHEYQAGLVPVRTLKGNFKMKREHKLAWKVAKPYVQFIISNGTHLSIYDKDIRQLIIRPLNKDALPPFFLLNDAGFEDMQVTSLGKDEFLLRAAQEGGIYMRFQEDLPVETHWEDYSGQRIVLFLSNIAANKRIAERNFRYKPPAGTDIILQEE